MQIDAKTEVTAAELGLLFGVSRKRIEQMATEGLTVRIGKGRFLLVESMKRHREVMQQRQVARSEADSQVRGLKARDLELRIRERERRHVAEAQAETLKICDEFGGPLKSDLMALPARLTMDLALRRRMEDAISRAFNDAAKRAGAAADMVRPDV